MTIAIRLPDAASPTDVSNATTTILTAIAALGTPAQATALAALAAAAGSPAQAAALAADAAAILSALPSSGDYEGSLT